jgi:hypothetical protein
VEQGLSDMHDMTIRQSTNLPIQVRVLFVNCPRLDTRACAYLILAQNEVQTEFEFIIHHHWVFASKTLERTPLRAKFLGYWAGSVLPLREWAYRRMASILDKAKAPICKTELNPNTAAADIAQLVTMHDHWFKDLPAPYGGGESFNGGTIVVTETAFQGAYFATALDKIAVISVAHWERHFSPPSVLEFILKMTQRYTTRICFGSNVGSHYSTRGCIWDFCANVTDAKITTSVKFVCAKCRAALQACMSPEKLQAFGSLIDHAWIGKTEEPGSIASNLKRVFHYDLARTQGLSPGFLDKLKDLGSRHIAEYLAKTAITIIGIVLGLVFFHKLHFTIQDLWPK